MGFEKIMWGIFGSEYEAVTGSWEKWREKNFYNLKSTRTYLNWIYRIYF
jgi:hypothetical protein